EILILKCRLLLDSVENGGTLKVLKTGRSKLVWVESADARRDNHRLCEVLAPVGSEVDRAVFQVFQGEHSFLKAHSRVPLDGLLEKEFDQVFADYLGETGCIVDVLVGVEGKGSGVRGQGSGVRGQKAESGRQRPSP